MPINEYFLGHQWKMTESVTAVQSPLHGYRFSVVMFDVQAAFAALCQGAVFDRFPHLKVLLLETGGGWIAHFLERVVDRMAEQRALRAVSTERGRDSEEDGRARFTAHTAFDHPTSPPDAAPRESIEVRALVFFAPEKKDAEQGAVTAQGSTALSAQ